MSSIPSPTESELRILHYLWSHGAASVRDVHEHFADGRSVGYTTTLKLMQIMANKGLVKRDTSHRIHIYTAAVREENIQKSLLDSFLDKAFAGSAARLVLETLGNHRTTREELNAIRAILDDLDQESE